MASGFLSGALPRKQLTVEWMNDIDIAPEELYLDSVAV
jgi:hypothetical protein